jgi:hypothetical protein
MYFFHAKIICLFSVASAKNLSENMPNFVIHFSMPIKKEKQFFSVLNT